MAKSMIRRAPATRAAALLALAAALLLGGCSFFAQNPGAKPGAKGSVSITVPRVSPYLSLGKAAQAASGARGYMFLDSLALTIKDSNGDTAYSSDIGNGVTGQTIKASISLPVGDYILDLEGTNGQESTFAIVASYGNSFSIAAGTTTELRIGLKPVSYSTLAPGGAAVSASSNTGVYYADATYSNGGYWTRNAGEKWYAITPVTSNTITINATSSSSHVYFGFYNADGQMLGGALSSGFGTGSYGQAASLFKGVTPGATYYIGAVLALEYAYSTAGTPTSDSFTINCDYSSVGDDSYEAIAGQENDSGANAVALAASPVTGLLAFDVDWYSIELSAGSPFSVTATFDAGSPIVGQLRVFDPNGEEYQKAECHDDSNPVSSLSVSGTANGAGTYRICVDVHSIDTMKFPVAGGGYSIAYTTESDTAFANAETQIPDTVLRSVIEAKVSENTGIAKTFGSTINPIMVSDMNAITGLEHQGATGSRIGDLTGIGNCPNLSWISFIGNAITDLSPLSSLAQLADIQVGGNYVTDLSPLSSMSSLRYVRVPNENLSGGGLNSLTGILELSGLEGVALHGNPLPWSELEKLNGTSFPNLVFLSIDGADEMTNTSLGVTSSQVVALLEGHKDKLSSLRLRKFAGFGDAGFASLYNGIIGARAAEYQVLSLQGWGMTSADSTTLLATFTGLYELQLTGNHLPSCDFLDGMTELESLSWSYGAPSGIVAKVDALHGATSSPAFTESEAYIELLYNGLDLRSSTTEYGMISSLVNSGVDVQYIEGNIVHDSVYVASPADGASVAKGASFSVTGTVSEWADYGSSIGIGIYIDGSKWMTTTADTTGSGQFTAKDLDSSSLSLGTHTLSVQATDASGGLSSPREQSLIVGVPVTVVIQ